MFIKRKITAEQLVALATLLASDENCVTGNDVGSQAVCLLGDSGAGSFNRREVTQLTRLKRDGVRYDIEIEVTDVIGRREKNLDTGHMDTVGWVPTPIRFIHRLMTAITQ